MLSKFVEKYNKLYARNSEVENILWVLMAALPTETKNNLAARFPWFKKINELTAEREEYLRGPGLDLKDFDSKNLMMSVKYWPEDRALYFNKEEREWYGPLVTEYFEWANQ